MDAMQQQAMSQATGRRAELELQRITAALDRMNSGEYGYCMKCEEEIAEGRLRVDPTTLLCISCAQKAEKR
ncbi:MAG: TraR/DksA family transcriptional regulator [Nitrospirae bacterium]|nr:TraR/DksA family transcriptional regulator [Nitrospirota bacterium]